MIRRPPRSTRTDTLFPYTTLFRSNIWIDEARARQRRAKTFALEEEGENAPDPGDRRIEAAVELSDVARAMARLPDEQREVIALVLVDGFAHREAAEILDIPLGTLKIGREHV